MFYRQRLITDLSGSHPRIPGIHRAEPDGQAIELADLSNNRTPANIPASPPPGYIPQPEEDEQLAAKVSAHVDRVVLTFVGIIWLAIELDRVMFSLYNPYFEVVLGLTATQYNMVALAREIGYIAGQIPSNLILNMFDKPANYLCAVTFAWAASQMLRACMAGFIGVLICCLISGILESAFFYPSQDLSKKVGLMGIILPLTRILTAAAGEPDYSLSMSLGGLSFTYKFYVLVFGIILAVLITEVERQVVLSRLAQSYGWPHPDSYENGRRTWLMSLKGLRMACLDPKTWLLAATCLFVSFPIPWLSDLRHLNLVLLPITDPRLTNAAVIVTLAYHLCVASWGGYIASRFQKRGLFINISQGIVLVGGVLIMLSEIIISNIKVDPPQLLFLGAFVCLPAAYFCLSIAFAWVLNCTPWDRSKRAACIAIVTTLSSTGNIYAIFAPPFDIREEGRTLNQILVGVLIILAASAFTSSILLGALLANANGWLNHRNEPDAQPRLRAERWLQDERFRDPEHTFRFRL
ncbi:MFS general substrate transporter [Hypoxylon sp. NC0597]|nr:MFS general substrate transporter [Hypoxylon sp. NC0597]